MNLKKHEDRTAKNFYDIEQINGRKGNVSRFYRGDKNHIISDNRVRQIFTIVLILGLLYVTIWFFIVDNMYAPYTKGMTDGYINIEEYKLSVEKPRFLSYRGTLLVNNEETDDTLIIWPKKNDVFEYSYIFTDENVKYQVYIDENLNVSDNSWPLAVEKVNERQQEIKDLYDIANSYWNFD